MQYQLVAQLDPILQLLNSLLSQNQFGWCCCSEQPGRQGRASRYHAQRRKQLRSTRWTPSSVILIKRSSRVTEACARKLKETRIAKPVRAAAVARAGRKRSVLPDVAVHHTEAPSRMNARRRKLANRRQPRTAVSCNVRSSATRTR